MIGVCKMDTVKKTQPKRKLTRKKRASVRQVMRASFFFVLGILIVYIYYLSTKDQLQSQFVRLSSNVADLIKSIPMPVFFLIGYSALLFYAGYLVGKKRG
jgi:hypothetical protein